MKCTVAPEVLSEFESMEIKSGSASSRTEMLI